MKNVQISEELFYMLIRFHLLQGDLWQEEIETELQKKLDAMGNRNLHTKYKTAITAEEQEQARQDYLDRKGYFSLAETKGKYAFLVCTPVDRSHVHSHIIFNSTALDYSEKFRNFRGSSFAIRKIMDSMIWDKMLSAFEVQFPIICSDYALQDKHFEKGA